MIRLNTAAILLLSCIIAATAAAVPGDRERPIRGKAHRTTLDGNTGQTTLTGDVIITQGTLSIYADEVIFQRDPETRRINYLIAKGNPARFIDTPDAGQPPVEMQGARIEYFPDQSKIITLGQARLLQSSNEASGERIEYNTETGVMVIESARLVNDDEQAPQAEFILQPEVLD